MKWPKAPLSDDRLPGLAGFAVATLTILVLAVFGFGSLWFLAALAIAWGLAAMIAEFVRNKIKAKRRSATERHEIETFD
jgi:hypothetical protein